jgi:hypothetical protein
MQESDGDQQSWHLEADVSLSCSSLLRGKGTVQEAAQALQPLLKLVPRCCTPPCITLHMQDKLHDVALLHVPSQVTWYYRLGVVP